MMFLTKDKRYDLIDAFNSNSRYLNDLLNIDTLKGSYKWPFFKHIFF